MIIAEGRAEVRWYRVSDFPQLKALYKVAFPAEKWEMKDFVAFIERTKSEGTKHGNILKVLGIQDSSLVLGAVMYTLEDADTCRIRRVAIVEKFQRKGLGLFLLSTALTGRRSPLRRKHFVARVDEYNYPTQALLQKLTFKVNATAKRQQRNGHDIYEFTYDKPETFAKLEAV